MRSIKEYQTNKSNYTLQNILGQSLWYARNSILSVSLMSGFGLPWNYDRESINNWFGTLDNLGIRHTIPENVTLLRSIYKKGTPRYCNPYNGNTRDYTNFIWDDSTYKKCITPASQAYLIMDEIMLGKYLHKCLDSTLPSSDSIAEKTAIAVLLIKSAVIQSQFMSDYLRNFDGLFIPKTDISQNPYGTPELEDTDTNPSVWDQALAMKAFSMLSDCLDDSEYPLFRELGDASGNKKHASEIYCVFLDSPDDIFSGKTRDLCNVISSCIQYYKASPESPDILDYITMLSLELESRIDMSGNLTRFADQNSLTSNSSCFLAVKTLIESYRLTGIYKFLESSQLLYKKLDLLWDPASSLYSLDTDDKYKYTLRDVGSVLAGLNSIRLFGGEGYSDDASNKLLSFFDSAVNRSGLVCSCMPPPLENDCEGCQSRARTGAGSIIYEDFSHIDIPQFLEVGVAPVFAKKFTFKAKKHKYNVNSSDFYSEYALFTAHEMLCMNYPEIKYFYSREECKGLHGKGLSLEFEEPAHEAELDTHGQDMDSESEFQEQVSLLDDSQDCSKND